MMSGARQTWRWPLSLMGAVIVLLCAGAAMADESETLQRAMDLALQHLGQDLTQEEFRDTRNIAVVPLRGDVNEYATDRVRDLVTGTKYALITRSDATWDTLLGEIEWGVRREDVMNPDTVQMFGKIKGVDAILYGRIWDQSVNLWSIRGHVKVSLILADVETGQELWRSGPLEGEAFMHWSDAVTQFWRFPLLLFALVLILFVLFIFVRKIKKAYKPV